MSPFLTRLADTLLGTTDGLTMLVTAIAYLVIAVWSYRQFGKLEIAFGASSFSPITRSWTTRSRYAMALAVYISLYLGAFRIVQEYPELKAFAQEAMPDLAQGLGALEQQFPWASPAITAAILIGAAEFPVTRKADAFLRESLQRMAAIPRRVRLLMQEIAAARFDPTDAAELGASGEALPERLLLSRGKPVGKTLESLCLASWQLDRVLADWRAGDSPFYDFQTVYQAPLDQLQTDYAAAELAAEGVFAQRASGTISHAREDQCLRTLAEVFERQRGAVACAFLHKNLSAEQRVDCLSGYGIAIDARVSEDRLGEVLSVMRNDVVLVLLALVFFVYPLTIFLARVLIDWTTTDPLSYILFVWPLMIFCFCAACLLPALATHPRDGPAPPGTPQGFALTALPWLRALWVGLVSAALGTLSLGLLGALAFPGGFLASFSSMVWYAPYAFLLSAGVTLMLALRYLGRYQQLAEGLALSLAACLIGFPASLGRKAAMTTEEFLTLALTQEDSFIVMTMAMIAFTIGAVVPHAFRRNFPRSAGMPLDEPETGSEAERDSAARHA